MHWLNVCVIAGVVGVIHCSADDSTTTSGATGGSSGTGGSG